MALKVTKKVQGIVETELRKGTTKSRIAHILGISYEEVLVVIKRVKDSIRPDVGDRIHFTFRDQQMYGVIYKLLSNSAVVIIDWNSSTTVMKDICEDRTIVNFKDIIEFIGSSTNSVGESNLTPN
ncbi:DUF2187 domain-containing protein [Granulicatella elegans]|uniref:DUF2187 domain-containing protein n=1 Tax=Granulicatella elegans TaxID=137732 RepID=UPI0028D5D5FD|nr:DUF2187 domain-containing protein [Granulicatella elegans]